MSQTSGLVVELCAVFSDEPILIDLETGEPVEPSAPVTGCDWCHNFGNAIDVPPREGVDWRQIALDFSHQLDLSPPPHVVLRLMGNAQSRAPPIL